MRKALVLILGFILSGVVLLFSSTYLFKNGKNFFIKTEFRLKKEAVVLSVNEVFGGRYIHYPNQSSKATYQYKIEVLCNNDTIVLSKYTGDKKPNERKLILDNLIQTKKIKSTNVKVVDYIVDLNKEEQFFIKDGNFDCDNQGDCKYSKVYWDRKKNSLFMMIVLILVSLVIEILILKSIVKFIRFSFN